MSYELRIALLFLATPPCLPPTAFCLLFDDGTPPVQGEFREPRGSGLYVS
jgi:hypothetical protein